LYRLEAVFAPRAAALLLLSAAIALLPACVTTPVTGRKSFNLLSVSDDVAIGNQSYQQFLAEAPLAKPGPQADMVHNVMNRLVAVADDAGFEWDVKVIQDDKTVNAFALPGGKMAVYTGILPVTKDETGLAVVMGHEIGHVVARHGSERLSAAMPAQVILQFASGGGYAEEAEVAAGVYEMLFLRPWGRDQELEADHIGLIYMARAGYDPRAAVDFWTRMAETGGEEPPEFMSTHPSHGSRIEQIQALLPEALAIYEQASGSN
jgi:predicted Zn-dependent protease